jgi:hypothetical protein
VGLNKVSPNQRQEERGLKGNYDRSELVGTLSLHYRYYANHSGNLGKRSRNVTMSLSLRYLSSGCNEGLFTYQIIISSYFIIALFAYRIQNELLLLVMKCSVL